MLKIIFLGTSGSLPTVTRNPSSILLNYNGELILFDCGEGTQKQMMRAKTGMLKLSSIYISHFHADHVLGIPGLLQTMAFQGRTEPIEIFGPKGIFEFVNGIEKIGTTKLKYKLIIKELKKEDIIYKKYYFIKPIPTNHSIDSLGYIFQEYEKPGKFN